MTKTVSSLFAVGSIICTTVVQAAVITDSFSNNMEKTELSQIGTLDKFDSRLGILNQVTLTVKGNSASTTLLENTSSNNQIFSFNSTLNFFFNASSVGLDLPNPAFATSLASTEGLVDLGSGLILDLGTKTDSGTYVFTGAGISNFLASSSMATFDLSCSTTSESSFTGGGGNISISQTTLASCGAKVEYDYSARLTPLPEPAILWLIGAGLLSFNYLRKHQVV